MSRRASLASPVVVTAEPDLVAEHKEAILAALRWAWNELLQTNPQLLRSAEEEVITTALERLLNERAKGLRRAHWIEDFDAVIRGAKVTSADGRIEKQPDLHFRPIPYRNVRQPSDWAWFIECKIVDGTVKAELYCTRGVQRFATGEYAAKMPSGAMLGYVRDGQKPYGVLKSRLKDAFGTRSIKPNGSDGCRSKHDRSDLATPCVAIELTHVWLAVAPAA